MPGALEPGALRFVPAVGVLAACLSAAGPGGKGVDFDRDIRPILSDNCFTCHGPDEKQRMVGLRLDTREGVFAPRKGYQIIVPGNAAESRLYQKLSAADKAKRMPPPYSGRSLTAQQVELVRRWIDEGANWEVHWAYVPPHRPAIPAVRNKRWPRNPIDSFILARLEREGLRPSPEADKATLLRRVSFDLTGLPPTPAELDAFLADRSPHAYEAVVDRLLTSPHYGERMAMEWLDLARYADTHGYHIDSHRDMWPWRDWVIGAFNHNLPYSEFVVEQLAGDLLPGATLDQRVATGFNRNHMINFEGGAIPEEYQNEYVVDRVETTSVAFLGTTMGCARCHDHKYDPIKQKEFYQFCAFFNNIPEKGLDGRRGNAEPLVEIPNDNQKSALEQLSCELEAKKKSMPDETKLAEMQSEWEKTSLASLPPAPRDGLLAHYELEGSFQDSSGHYRHGRTVAGECTYVPGPVGKAAEFDGQTQVEGDGVLRPRLRTLQSGIEYSVPETGSAFALAFWMRATGRTPMSVLQEIDAANARRGFELSFDEWQPIPLLKRGAHLSIRLIHRWPDQSIQIETKQRLVASAWYQITIDYDGSGKAAGLVLYVNGKPEPVDVIADNLTGSIQNASPLEIGDKKLGSPYKGDLDDLRIYNRRLTAKEIESLVIHEPARATLFLQPGKRAKEQQERLREYYLRYGAPPPLRELNSQIERLTAEKERLEASIPTSMVMAEMEKPRDTFVLARGDYRNRGEKVTPGVPAILPPLPKGAPLNRLTLARWLVDPSHPLTARVAVNRYWQMYFGKGIVKTAEDFGSQGDPPSHPELLDWLATEFIRTGWDVKAMQRLIVTSAAYRQSSHVTPELLEKDPENRLLARGPRFRLPAEMVRDNALAISGLLDGRIGGPSVFPYQPKGLWEEIAYGDVYSAQVYTPSHGSDLYRRSMYTFWKRTSPPPELVTFDAPSREKCTARRTVTNTPLQALVLLNDPTFVEAARALAQQVILNAGPDPVRRIDFAFRLAICREPSPREVRVLRALATQELTAYRRDPEAARKLLQVGESTFDPKLSASELAAWTTVASTIFNLDETISKE